MPYVNRNEEGEIVQLLDAPNSENSEWLELASPEIVAFMQKPSSISNIKEALSGSDSEMIRVIEDLVDVLMEKGVFLFTELPEAAQSKLNARKKLRQDVNALDNLIGEDDNIL